MATQNLRNIIRQLAKSDGETVSLICTVDAVDKVARTVDCSPINESAPLLGVNLQANTEAGCGVCLFPEIGSYVVVGFIAEGAAGVVLLSEKIESAEIVIGDTTAVMDADGVRFNGGSLGGLVKVANLTERLNIIERDLNSLKTVFSGWLPVSQDGGAALKTEISTWAAAQLTLTSRSHYENSKIKQ